MGLGTEYKDAQIGPPSWCSQLGHEPRSVCRFCVLNHKACCPGAIGDQPRGRLLLILG